MATIVAQMEADLELASVMEGEETADPSSAIADTVTTQLQTETTSDVAAIVPAIVQAHRSKITVASAPGDGTTFTITLPAR